MRATSKVVATLAATALTVGGLAAATTSATGATSPSDRASAKRFNFISSAYGTRVYNKNGDLVDSGRTAWSLIACTSKTGKTDRDHLAKVELPGGQLSIGPVTTKARSVETKNGAKSVSTTKVGAIVLKASGIGSLKIEGLTGTSESSYANGKYAQKGSVDLLGIKAVLAGIEVPLPFNPDDINPGQEFLIPGLAKLRFLDNNGRVGSNVASNNSVALEIKVLTGGPLKGQTVRVGYARTKLEGIPKHGRVGGYGEAAHSELLDGVVSTGRVGYQKLSCTGTNGKWERNSVAGLKVPGAPVRIGAASGQARGTLGKSPVAHTRARIADVKLTNNLKIGAIESYAKVTKKNGKYKKTSGVSVLRVRAGGENVTKQINKAIKNQKSITIPGIAKITPNVVKKKKRSISVTGLKITLLDVAKPLSSAIYLANSEAKAK
ncbi:choice-of-anchor P family protein [Solicola gregarius]|uniref:Uncharacterized protein n=1 Tax=Solicola gregarius TaxID=2908642 RepID=A0AA46THP8_9ACTN|nr:choice-of-anchor P family protein [Solicola gregarius]UYM04718.1 hypothetical protein L0C25_19600 [Solicola gregarius]